TRGDCRGNTTRKRGTCDRHKCRITGTMIVFDENVHQRSIMDAVAAWYRGRVISVTVLRPDTIIKDEAIPTLLLRVLHPTLVTPNVDDFWQRVPAQARYGIVCLVLPDERLHEIPSLLRQLFSLPDFRTKARRMGKVVRVSRGPLEYYGAHTHYIIGVPSWPV